MHSSAHPAPAADTPEAEPDVRLSEELTSVVAGARRRAVRDGDGQIDTAHLLHSLLEADPAVRAAFADGAQVARLLGYLVQRSIGYGLQWQGTVEDSGAVPVVREASAFSPSAEAAMHAAVEAAARRGAQRASGNDLLDALLADPECRAVEVLRRAGVRPEEPSAENG
nr:Clp protease N-terminal domain-containing protein [Streptomyces triticagri]